ncbi:hypothetical protein BX589_12068 [Paraburkholderia fungorum]|jgi:phage tail sheath protein FI|uniref:hypothetical protein n=1 Tax=Paraburkholderia fungorum TaxID=134537 RepID=UPI000D082FBB|nr:hypothetical protein [Paraburkholderia fungorum]PRZ51227.1 hypothetical protein BX589_12068 [Paraburkholderia fungorum]
MGVAAIGIASLAMTAASAAMSAEGAQQQAKATASADQYQAQVAKNNQTIANQYAAQATADGENKVAIKQQQTAQMIGGERAAMAANGVDLNSGSALRIQGDTAKLGDVDALTIRNNAARAAYGYQLQGLSYGQQATLDESSAANAVSAGNLNSFASIVGGASSVGSKWSTYQMNGVFA